MKKYTPQERNIDSRHHLDGQPGRDHQALILPLSVIKPKENIRTDVTGIDELAESIRQHGLLQPLVVFKDNGGFTLIAGHRRLLALQKLDMKEAPVRIQAVDENHAQVLKLVENLQREDLSGADEIIAVAKLFIICNGNQTELAHVIGKSKTYVSRCLKAFEFIKTTGVATSQLSKSVLFELAENGASVKVLEDSDKPTVQEARKPSGPIPGGRAVERVIAYRERRQGQAFSLRVNFDFDKTTEGDRERLLKQLKDIIKKIEG